LKNTLKKALPFIVLVILVVAGCVKRFANEPLADQPPKTFLTLLPDSSLRSTQSEQHIHWWGVDPDGFVVGYYFSFDSVRWVYTTSTDSVFTLHLNTSDTTYSFFVKAIDNQGLMDPHPASLRYPIFNSPPSVSFIVNSNVPETTYTVATFQWAGSDPDGNQTIVNYYYALDDTTNLANWKQLSGDANLVTLFKGDGVTGGPTAGSTMHHFFFLKAKDVAGAYSKVIVMPDTSTTNGHIPEKFWNVREPKGDFLIVRDYLPTDFAVTFYNQIFDTLAIGGVSGRLYPYDIVDIKKGSSAIKRGDNVPALINPTFTETLKLFKYIFWYADNSPSLDIAQASLPQFKQAGGKVLFTGGFPQYIAAQGGLGDFVPIDNIEPSYFTTILQARDTIVSVDPAYPTLIRDTLGFIYTFPRGLLPKVNARVLYQMQKSSRWASRDTLPIIMGIKDSDQPSFILLGAILHRFGTPPKNVAAFLYRVFNDEFAVH
jgi:hypothetical protein